MICTVRVCSLHTLQFTEQRDYCGCFTWLAVTWNVQLWWYEWGIINRKVQGRKRSWSNVDRPTVLEFVRREQSLVGDHSNLLFSAIIAKHISHLQSDMFAHMLVYLAILRHRVIHLGYVTQKKLWWNYGIMNTKVWSSTCNVACVLATFWSKWRKLQRGFEMHTYLADNMCSHVDIPSVPIEHVIETHNKQ